VLRDFDAAHNRRIFRATRAISKREDEAEDVMQEA